MVTLDNLADWEKEFFPEFKGNRTLVSGPEKTWFAPSYYAEKGLITQDLVEDMTAGARLLSVGCGAAHLERSLVHAFGAKPSQIVLADREPVAVPGFTVMKLDMYDAWPRLGDFNYVLFPRSVFLGTTRPVSEKRDDAKALTHLLQESYWSLFSTGEMRMMGYLPAKEIINEVRKSFIDKDVRISYLKVEDFGYGPSHADFLKMKRS